MDSTQDTQSDLLVDDVISSGMQQYLTFILAEEEYGVDILQVQEIKGWDSVTEIPNTPEYIQGVINLRGTIVPIIDLRLCFELPKIEYNNMTVVIVLNIQSEKGVRTMGFVVDAVSEVYNIDSSDLKDAPDFGAHVDSDYINGLATVDEKMLILLNMDKLVNENDINAINESIH